MVATQVGSTLEAERLEEERARQLVNKTRRARVELLQLPYCRVCGGTTADDEVLDLIEDAEELPCVCVSRTHALIDRVTRIREQARAS